jgi:hypothetical protein
MSSRIYLFIASSNGQFINKVCCHCNLFLHLIFASEILGVIYTYIVYVILPWP